MNTLITVLRKLRGWPAGAFLLVLLLSMTSCIYEHRVECLDIALDANVRSDGRVLLDVSVPVGDISGTFSLDFLVDGRIVDNIEGVDFHFDPKEVTVPDSRILHLWMPVTKDGEHTIEATLQDESFRATAKDTYSVDGISISAFLDKGDTGRTVTVILDKGDLSADYSLTVILDGSAFIPTDWKGKAVDPAFFRFASDRSISFVLPVLETGEHVMTITVADGFRTGMATLTFSEENDLAASLDIESVTDVYYVDLFLNKGRTDRTYTMEVILDGKPYDGLVGRNTTVDRSKVSFGEDRRLKLKMPLLEYGEHTLTVKITDGDRSCTCSKTIVRSNTLSAVLGTVSRDEETLSSSLMLLDGDLSRTYTVEWAVDGKKLSPTSTTVASFNGFKFPSDRKVNVTFPLPDFEAHELQAVVHDGQYTCETKQAFHFPNDLACSIGVSMTYDLNNSTANGFGAKDSVNSDYGITLQVTDGLTDIPYTVAAKVDGKNYTGLVFDNGNSYKVSRFLNGSFRMTMAMLSFGSHTIALTLSSHGKEWTFTKKFDDERIIYKVNYSLTAGKAEPYDYKGEEFHGTGMKRYDVDKVITWANVNDQNCKFYDRQHQRMKLTAEILLERGRSGSYEFSWSSRIAGVQNIQLVTDCSVSGYPVSLTQGKSVKLVLQDGPTATEGSLNAGIPSYKDNLFSSTLTCPSAASEFRTVSRETDYDCNRGITGIATLLTTAWRAQESSPAPKYKPLAFIAYKNYIKVLETNQTESNYQEMMNLISPAFASGAPVKIERMGSGTNSGWKGTYLTFMDKCAPVLHYDTDGLDLDVQLPEYEMSEDYWTGSMKTTITGKKAKTTFTLNKGWALDGYSLKMTYMENGLLKIKTFVNVNITFGENRTAVYEYDVPDTDKYTITLQKYSRSITSTVSL